MDEGENNPLLASKLENFLFQHNYIGIQYSLSVWGGLGWCTFSHAFTLLYFELRNLKKN